MECTAAVETESGYQVLLTGTAKKNKKGMVNQLTTDKNGTIQNWAGWKDISWAANNGWESQFQSDINKNGIIDNESTLNFQANPITSATILTSDLNNKSLIKTDNITGEDIKIYIDNGPNQISNSDNSSFLANMA